MCDGEEIIFLSVLSLEELQARSEVNTKKTQYMLLSHHQNAGQNHDIEIASRCFENVAQFKYLGMTVTSKT
jgi:hypothetical protein